MSQQLSFFGRQIPPPEPPLVGYNLTADKLIQDEEPWCTFMFARTLEAAVDWAIYYFPMEKGYIHLEVRNVDTRRTYRLMSHQYIEKDGSFASATNTLSSEKELELSQHIPQCEICLQDCRDCWEYYSNMGHDKYVEVLVGGMDVNHTKNN